MFGLLKRLREKEEQLDNLLERVEQIEKSLASHYQHVHGMKSNVKKIEVLGE